MDWMTMPSKIPLLKEILPPQYCSYVNTAWCMYLKEKSCVSFLVTSLSTWLFELNGTFFCKYLSALHLPSTWSRVWISWVWFVGILLGNYLAIGQRLDYLWCLLPVWYNKNINISIVIRCLLELHVYHSTLPPVMAFTMAFLYRNLWE